MSFHSRFRRFIHDLGLHNSLRLHPLPTGHGGAHTDTHTHRPLFAWLSLVPCNKQQAYFSVVIRNSNKFNNQVE